VATDRSKFFSSSLARHANTKYTIGDKLRWRHNNVGRPGLTRVEVSAVTEACPVCNTSGQDFVVTIEDDTITGVERAPKRPPPVTDGELYQVIEE
jgi:hypothetical protein